MIKLENVSKTFGRGVDEVHALHNSRCILEEDRSTGWLAQAVRAKAR